MFPLMTIPDWKGYEEEVQKRVQRLLWAIAEYRRWFDTCTRTVEPDWEDLAASASMELDAAIKKVEPLTK